MNRSTTTAVSFAFSAAFAAAATAHHIHVTLDTLAGQAGDPVAIKAGYLPAESEMSVTAGRLYHHDQIAVFRAGDALPQAGAFNNWGGGTEVLLTSDFYLATGRLDGGNFAYEIASVTPVSGGPGTMAWGAFSGGVFSAFGTSDAGDRVGRSYVLGAGTHNHAQGYAFSAAGVYDVTFVGWDVNGKYADSAPVTVRFEAVPAPGVSAGLAMGGIALMRRRRQPDPDIA